MTRKAHNQRFEASLKKFVKELESYISTETGEWTIKGFIDVYKNIYTISSDTKIVSKIIEIHLFPKLLDFAERNGYRVILADHQNYYPDLTLIHKEDERVKLALDLKTTYRRNGKISGFTLGSHGSYFKKRDKAKNIQYPYNEYWGHYCLGVIYTRTDFEDALAEASVNRVEELEEPYDKSEPIGPRNVTHFKNLKSIASVIRDFEFFAAPKWKIASDSRGSGNTANIGSIKNIEALKAGKGVFSELGEEWFDEYWMNYKTATMVKEGNVRPITNIWDFLDFKGRTDLFDKVGIGAKKRKK